MSSRVPGLRIRIVLSVFISLSALIAILIFVDRSALAQRFAALDPFWVGAALFISVPQYVLSAGRWRLIATRLGASLTLREATTEYYLAVLGNQLLPGGVLGDVARAFRHGRRAKAQGVAFRAVIYERAAGQLALLAVMLPGLLAWPLIYDEGAQALEVSSAVALIVMGCAAILVLLTMGPLSQSATALVIRRFLREGAEALFARAVFARQALYSAAVLTTYLLCFYCTARAVGFRLDVLQVLTLVPAVLFAMNVPFTISGWGIREATAAAIWNLAGLTAVDGVAVSIAYGAVVLLSALPGIAVILASLGKRDFGNER